MWSCLGPESWLLSYVVSDAECFCNRVHMHLFSQRDMVLSIYGYRTCPLQKLQWSLTRKHARMRTNTCHKTCSLHALAFDGCHQTWCMFASFCRGSAGKKNSITSRQQSLTRNHASNEAEYMSQKPSLIHDWCRHTQFMCTNFWGEVYNTVEYVLPLLGKPWFPQQDHPKKNNFTFFFAVSNRFGKLLGVMWFEDCCRLYSPEYKKPRIATF